MINVSSVFEVNLSLNLEIIQHFYIYLKIQWLLTLENNTFTWPKSQSKLRDTKICSMPWTKSSRPMLTWQLRRETFCPLPIKTPSVQGEQPGGSSAPSRKNRKPRAQRILHFWEAIKRRSEASWTDTATKS